MLDCLIMNYCILLSILLATYVYLFFCKVAAFCDSSGWKSTQKGPNSKNYTLFFNFYQMPFRLKTHWHGTPPEHLLVSLQCLGHCGREWIAKQRERVERELHLENKTRSHPEVVGDMSHETLNFDLSKIPCVRF